MSAVMFSLAALIIGQAAPQLSLSDIKGLPYERRPDVETPAILSTGLVGAAQARVGCAVTPNREVRDCEVISETPAGLGFGTALARGAEGAVLAEEWLTQTEDRTKVVIPMTFIHVPGGTGPVTASDILFRLDMMSFPNSLRPSRGEGRKYPVDWGFTDIQRNDESATLERPGDWAISLRILRQEGDGWIVCFSDRALNGGSYRANSALRVVSDRVRRFTAVGTVVDPDCRPAPGQG